MIYQRSDPGGDNGRVIVSLGGGPGSGGHACLPCLDAVGQSGRAGPRVSERATSFQLIALISTCQLTGTDLWDNQRL